MPETLDTREEQQLLTAVKQANDLVVSGLSPNAAIEKVARDNGFGPGKIRLMGQAYNTGQQLAQWRTESKSILDKLASYELCDPQKVIDNIYKTSTTKEASVSVEYTRPPHWLKNATREKTASYKLPTTQTEAYKPEPTEAVEKAFSVIQRHKLAADEARRQAAEATDKVRADVAQVVTYFKQASYARLPFELVETAARSYYGDPAVTLLDLTYKSAGLREKRASAAVPVLRQPLNQQAAPFTLIKAALASAERCNSLKKIAKDLDAKTKEVKAEELRPFVEAGKAQQSAETSPWLKSAAALFVNEKQAFGFGTEVAAIAAGDILAHKATHGEQEDDPYGDISGLDEDLNAVRQQAALAKRRKPVEKKAFLGAGIGAALGGSMGRTMGSPGKTKDDLVDDAWMGLEDPEHDNALRKIRAHAMINQLMTDPDDPISGYDPDSVLNAYNEISSATPRLAQNVATLRPALRKRLEGHQEPFEAKELLEIEKGLAQSKNPTPTTNILSKAPEHLLG